MKGNKKINLKKTTLCLFVGLVVLVGLIVCLVSWRGSTKDIEAVADSFRPLDGWQQTKYEVVPPQFLCFSGACPEISKAWTVPNQIKQKDVKKFIGNFSQVNANHSRCMDYENNKTLDLCEYIGEKGGYQFDVMIDYQSSDNKTNIELFIRRKGYIYD
jgi:hypothetical protein